MSMNRIYLDYNATAPLGRAARAALLASLDIIGNPASVHMEGRAAKALVQKARAAVAALVGAEKDNVVFTSGATESAANLLTPHYVLGRKPLVMSRLYLGATEHPAVAAGGFFPPEQRAIIPTDKNGLIAPAALAEILAGHDKSAGLPLVAIQYANHETGIIQPVAELAQIIRAAGGIFIVDAVQALGKIPVSLAQCGADFLIIAAHKIGGLKGAGAYIASGALLRPKALMSGGGQEKGLRGGTSPVQLLAAMGAAADETAAALEAGEAQRLAVLQQQLEQGIKAICPQAVIYGADAPRLPNTTAFSVPNIKAETLQIAFDLAGIAVSNGAACSSGKVGQSAVLVAMGAAAAESGAVRVSAGAATQSADIGQFLAVLQKILKK